MPRHSRGGSHEIAILEDVAEAAGRPGACAHQVLHQYLPYWHLPIGTPASVTSSSHRNLCSSTNSARSSVVIALVLETAKKSVSASTGSGLPASSRRNHLQIRPCGRSACCSPMSDESRESIQLRNANQFRACSKFCWIHVRWHSLFGHLRSPPINEKPSLM